MALEVTTKRENELTAEEARELNETSRLAFAGDGSEDLCWSNSDWFVLGKIDGQVVSVVGILTREVRVGDQAVTVGGIGGVATHPAHQRKGYAAELMRRAGEFLRAPLGVPFGLLNCAPKRIPFYSSFGWEEMRAPMYFTCRGERRLYQGPVMILRLTEETWPEGDVDLQGGPW